MTRKPYLPPQTAKIRLCHSQMLLLSGGSPDGDVRDVYREEDINEEYTHKKSIWG